MKATALIVMLLVSIASVAQPAFRFSIKPTYSFTRVTGDLKDAMIKSGFNDDSYGWFSSSPSHNPTTRRAGLGLIAELEKTTSKSISYSIVAGLPDWGKVMGYDALGIGNYLFVRYATWVVNPAIDYHYSHNKVTAGPTLALFQYKVEKGVPSKGRALTAGLSVANTFFPAEHKKIKTGFYLQANLLPNITTREIRKNIWGTSGYEDNYGATTSTFYVSKVNLSNLQIGLAIQF